MFLIYSLHWFFAFQLKVVDEAVRYIRELEEALANKVCSEGGLILPEFDELTKTTNSDLDSFSTSSNSTYHSLESMTEVSSDSTKLDKKNTSVNIIKVDKRSDLRNLVKQLIITPQINYGSDCNEILNGFIKTSISETTANRDWHHCTIYKLTLFIEGICIVNRQA